MVWQMPQWVLIIDEATHYKKCFLLHHKNDQIQLILAWIKQLLNHHKIKAKTICLDSETACTEHTWLQKILVKSLL